VGEVELPPRSRWGKLLAEVVQMVDRGDVRHGAILERFASHRDVAKIVAAELPYAGNSNQLALDAMRFRRALSLGRRHFNQHRARIAGVADAPKAFHIPQKTQLWRLRFREPTPTGWSHRRFIFWCRSPSSRRVNSPPRRQWRQPSLLWLILYKLGSFSLAKAERGIPG
jgi:hypothetical protein